MNNPLTNDRLNDLITRYSKKLVASALKEFEIKFVGEPIVLAITNVQEDAE
jgi:hypothetical protein